MKQILLKSRMWYILAVFSKCIFQQLLYKYCKFEKYVWYNAQMIFQELPKICLHVKIGIFS